MEGESFAATGVTMFRMRNRRNGMTLMELMCCIAIIAIIASMYLGVIGKAYQMIKKVVGAE